MFLVPHSVRPLTIKVRHLKGDKGQGYLLEVLSKIHLLRSHVPITPIIGPNCSFLKPWLRDEGLTPSSSNRGG